MNIFIEHTQFLKNEAEILLKHLQGDKPALRESAVSRFHQLASFSELSSTDRQTIDAIQHKHALTVVAVENGYDSWAELKKALETAASSPVAEIDEQFYPKSFTTYWNIWFAKYAQAKKVLNEGKGYLLPYKHQFFICEEHFVDSIGIPHTLPEWDMIGRDWIHPKNVKAWLDLNDIFVRATKDRTKKS